MNARRARSARSGEPREPPSILAGRPELHEVTQAIGEVRGDGDAMRAIRRAP